MVEKDSLFQFKLNPIIHDKAVRQSVTPYHFTTMQCKFNACLQTDHPHTSFSLSPASPIQRKGGGMEVVIALLTQRKGYWLFIVHFQSCPWLWSLLFFLVRVYVETGSYFQHEYPGRQVLSPLTTRHNYNKHITHWTSTTHNVDNLDARELPSHQLKSARHLIAICNSVPVEMTSPYLPQFRQQDNQL